MNCIHLIFYFSWSLWIPVSLLNGLPWLNKVTYFFTSLLLTSYWLAYKQLSWKVLLFSRNLIGQLCLGGSSYCRLQVVPIFSQGLEERAKCEHVWKSPQVRKERRAGEREKWGSTDKAQAFDPSWPTDFGVRRSCLLLNQLSASNGIPSPIELSLLLSLGNCGGYLLQVKENPDTNFLWSCFAWRTL